VRREHPVIPDSSDDVDDKTQADRPVAPQDASRPTRRRRLACLPRRLHQRTPRWLKVVGVVIGVMVLLVGASFTRAMVASNNLTMGERAAEWARDNHMGGVVNRVENWWFTAHAPEVGGVPDRAIAADPSPTTTAAPGTPHLPPPVSVPVPSGVTPVPNEGVWEPAGPPVGGVQPMYTTQVRPDSVHTSLLSGLAWMDPQLARFEMHPGTNEPGGSWSVPSEVPAEEAPQLLAAFNGGFRLQDANGGFFLDGTTKGTLRDGAASFVIYADGTATVGMWGRDVRMAPDVVAVRQNLDLIIDNGGGPPGVAGRPVAEAEPGVAAPGLDDNANGAWGDTLGNKVLVWRSGVCVTASGALVYGYGDGLGALSLSELLMRAGCVRAMELDINTSWTTFNTYSPTPDDPGSVHGLKLLPEQSKGADRYLTNDARDFIAAFCRDLPVPGTPPTTAPPTTAAPTTVAPATRPPAARAPTTVPHHSGRAPTAPTRPTARR